MPPEPCLSKNRQGVNQKDFTTQRTRLCAAPLLFQLYHYFAKPSNRHTERGDRAVTRWLIRLFIKDSEDTSKPAVRAAYGNLACVAGIFCNLLLFAGKFTVGTLFGSVAIAADGMNNLSDAGSSVVSLIGFRLGARPADDKHPFGHARYEYLAGLAVSVMIMVIGVELLKESVAKLIHPTTVEFGLLTGVVLVASLGATIWF